MNNEIIFLTRAYLPDYQEYIEEIKDLWDSHWITSMGKKHNMLEKALESALNVPYVTVFTNGHNALELLINAMGLTGEVITTPFTFISTTHAIVRNGLTPVFCDIKKDDFTIDPDKIEAVINEKTSAIIGVHVYGNPCDVEKINMIAEKHNLKVIYDAAHAFGEWYNEKNLAEYGDASIFSFHASKVFNSIEGGCAVCKDETINSVLNKLRNFGINDGDVEYVGTNAKMNEFVAAMGICNLRHLDEVICRRRILTKYYEEQLDGIKGIQLKTNLTKEGLRSNCAYLPLIVDDKTIKRDNLYDILNKNGVQALRHFYPLTSQYSCYNCEKNGNTTPVAVWVSKHILLLPLYADLRTEQIDYICKVIREYVNNEERK